VGRLAHHGGLFVMTGESLGWHLWTRLARTAETPAGE
jgi:hypothetical protein